MRKCLVVFHYGKIEMLLEAAGDEFGRAVKLWFAENGHTVSVASGDEAWIVPASAFHEAVALFEGDNERQRKAIRTADGAIEAAQFLEYGRA